MEHGIKRVGKQRIAYRRAEMENGCVVIKYANLARLSYAVLYRMADQLAAGSDRGDDNSIAIMHVFDAIAQKTGPAL